MALRGWKGLALVGLLGSLAVAAGCNERSDAKVKENARQVGREVGKAAEDVKEAGQDAAKQMKEAGHEAAEGVREGYGGAGRKDDEPKVGHNPGVIHDGEGPLEERESR